MSDATRSGGDGSDEKDTDPNPYESPSSTNDGDP